MPSVANKFLSAVSCSTPHRQLSTQTCLSSKREGKQRSWTSPQPISAHGKSGFNAGEKGCKQNKRWFVLMVYSQDKNPFSSITCLAPFLQRREEEEKEAEWRWFKGITRTIKEEGKGNKGSKRNSALFQQVTLCLLAVWGWHARLHVRTRGPARTNANELPFISS